MPRSVPATRPSSTPFVATAIGVGVLLENDVARFRNDAEALYSYEARAR